MKQFNFLVIHFLIIIIQVSLLVPHFLPDGHTTFFKSAILGSFRYNKSATFLSCASPHIANPPWETEDETPLDEI